MREMDEWLDKVIARIRALEERMNEVAEWINEHKQARGKHDPK